jgi:23S rRNA pseudouridine1911/1915/1917 synthase
MSNQDNPYAGELITENVRERRYEVDGNNDGWRLDRFLAQCMPRISRSLAGRIARDGDVEVIPPRKVKAGTRLRNNDVVIVRQALDPERVQDADVEVIYRDEALVVVAKPAGMLVHESSSVRLNTIQKYLERRGFDEAEPVHRLDRETSGVLICAASRRMVPVLRGMFATAHPDKIYRALVLDPDARWQVGERRTIETPLGNDLTSILDVKMGKGGLEARTHVEVLGRVEHAFGPMADLRVVIETGRQHQIRVHLAMQGTPIAGDKLYSVDDEYFMAICAQPDDPELLARVPFDRHALHAWKLRMPHPGDAEMMEFEAKLPAIWKSA